MPLLWHLQAHLLRALIITYMQPLINGVFLNSEKYYCMLKVIPSKKKLQREFVATLHSC